MPKKQYHLLSRFIYLALVTVILLNAGVIFAQQGESSITIDVDPPQVKAVDAPQERDFVVSFSITGEACPSVVRDVPVDVVLVLDISGSMADPTSDGIPKIDAMKSAVSGFLQRFNLNPSNPTTSDHIAVVAFDDSSYLIQNLTSNLADIQTGITTLSTGGGTNIADGIREGTNILNGPDANNVGNAVPVLILLSDGVSPDTAAVIDEAERARRTLSSDFQLVSIAFGPPDEVDFETLETISNRVYDTDSATQLNVLYDQVATLIQPRLAARQMTIRYQVVGSRFTAMADSANPPATFDAASQTFTWVYDELKTGQVAEFRFEAQSNIAGNPSDVGSISAEYLPCAEATPIVDTAIGPLMQLLTPTPTPTFTPTATATNTPTPTVTPTATPNSILRNDPMLPPTQEGVNTGFCVGGANNWISWLILALLLLLGLWISARLFRRLPPRSVRHWRDVSCLLLQILTLFALLFLLWGLLNPLVGLLCPKPESIYFWRMSGGERGIFLTHENLQRNAPAQVSSLNQECVGCHTVDNQNGRLAAIVGLGNLAIVNFNGERVSTPPIDAIYADFSPDGNKLAVSTGDADLYIIDLITQTSQQLTQASDGTYGALMPNWHPNGQDIAFVRAPKSNIEYGLAIVGSSDIYTVSVSGGSISPINGASNNERLNYYPNYSPDGRWLSITSHDGTTTYSDSSADIWLVDTTNGNARALGVNDPNASDSWAVWNREGDTLAFNTTRYDQSFDIMLVDIDPLSGMDSNERLLAGASEPGVFEHLPFWGRPIGQEPILMQWGRLWPTWFIPFLILFPLMLLCILLPKPKKQTPIPPSPTEVIPPPPMGKPAARILLPITPLWNPRTTLVIGIGDAGWYILTQLKKTLYDAGIGKAPHNVRLLSIIAGTEGRLLNNVGGGLPLVDEECIQLRDNIASLLDDNPQQDASLRHWLQSTQIKGTVGDNISPENGLQDERVFGRMAYIANQRGIHQRTGINIHDQVVQVACEILGNTTKGQILTVVIVAELGDALASGSFMDLALLGKRLKEELGLNELYQVGHLLTTHANEGMPADKKKVNTAAALRELIRAELAASRGDMTFPFVYDTEFRSSRNVMWKNSLLFNELYLYDGNRENERMSNFPPQFAIYPAVSDLISTWMDEASTQGRLGGVRASAMGVTRSAQVREQTLMGGSMGVYQYRLPFTDIVEDVSVRYAQEVISILLMGRVHKGESPRINKETALYAEDHFRGVPSDPTGLAKAFFAGQLGESQDFDEHWRAIFKAFSNSNNYDLQYWLKKVQVKEEHNTQSWRKWLTKFILLLLNGSQESLPGSSIGDDATTVDEQKTPTTIRQRGAKLPLAVFVLQIIGYEEGGMLHRYAGMLEDKDFVNHPIKKVLMDFATIAREMRDNLTAIAKLLGVNEELESVYVLLAQRAQQVDSRFNLMKNLKTRHYIVEDDNGQSLRDAWYQKYLYAHVADGLDRIHWQQDDDIRDGRITFTLELSPHEVSALDVGEIHDRMSVQNVVNALIEVARRIAKANGIEHESALSILQNNQLGEYQLAQTVNSLVRESSPMLGVDMQAQGVTQVTNGFILSAQRDLDQDQQLYNQIRDTRGFNQDRLVRMNTTDRFSLTLIQTVDTVPLTAVTSVNADFSLYRQTIGLEGTLYRAGASQLTAVYEAEAVSVRYERRLNEIQQSRRIFHPFLVSALSNEHKARAYLLAAAVGAEFAYGGKQLTLNAPEFNNIILIDMDSHDDRVNEMGIIVAGLLAFTSKDDITEESTKSFLARYRSMGGKFKSLISLFNQIEGSTWRATLPPNTSQKTTALNEDVIALARLMIIDELS